MKRYALLCFLFLVVSKAAAKQSFRNDYVYNSKTKAYYKLHIEPSPQRMAKLKCQNEDASLMVVTSEADKMQIHGMMKQYPDIGNLVHLGSDGLQHESAEELPIIDMQSSNEEDDYEYGSFGVASTKCEVLTRDNEIRKVSCWSSIPFACKVEESNLTYNEQCDTTIPNYKYYAASGSCYRASDNILTWAEACDECKNQGGHLVIINSEEEHQAVKEVLREAPSLRSSMNPIYILAGIRAKEPSREFRTIYNQTLEEAGYSKWNEGEPNNEGGEYCGSLGKSNGFYNDIPCHGRFGYICEKEVAH